MSRTADNSNTLGGTTPPRSRRRRGQLVAGGVATGVAALLLVGGFSASPDGWDKTLPAGGLDFQAGNVKVCAALADGEQSFIAGFRLKNPMSESVELGEFQLLQSENLVVTETVLLPWDTGAGLDSYPPKFLAEFWPDRLPVQSTVFQPDADARLYVVLTLQDSTLPEGFTDRFGLTYTIGERRYMATSQDFAVGATSNENCDWIAQFE